MLAHIVELSVRHRFVFTGLLAALLVAGGFAARELPIDAVPDVSTIQVAVLTEAPGLSPVEVEQAITFPIEAALNGVPHLVELRSVSRSGLSAVTVVFKETTDVWFARQLVLERIREVESALPPGAGTPQLGPVSTGLGEIFWFVVRSDHHGPSQLRTMLDWEIVPKLRSVPGVIEVNTLGGDLKQYEVRLDPARMRAQDVSLDEVREALERANRNAGGGYIERGAEAYSIRGTGLLANEDEISTVVVKRTGTSGAPVLVKHVADVAVGATLRQGLLTRDGKGEAVCGIVMMLLGANSRDVVHAVKARTQQIQADLPPGVIIDVVYDRADFVARTLTTVVKNLVEGLVIVALVLWLFLGTLRGSLAVVIGIPAAMSIALFGMHATGVTGDLMSLGAIDFGFLVDGAIVMLEAVVAAIAGKKLAGEKRLAALAKTCGSVARPVAFAIAIIMLVYLPLLSLEGIEGKMFKPMAIAMAFALLGALIYSVVFFPALATLLLPKDAGHGPHWVARVVEAYQKTLPAALRARLLLLGVAALLLFASVALLAGGGADFVPRIDEGDLVVTIRRAPSISLGEARRLDLETERVLHGFPEVVTTVGMTGRAEIAYDPVGNDNTDVLTHLRPPSEWKTAHDLDGLSEVIKSAVESQVPGTFVSVSQPIEDRTNELISGSRADVAIQLFGPDLETLRTASEQIGAIAKTIPGAGDVRIERILGLPTITVEPDRARLALHGVTVDEVFTTIEAARVGIRVGSVYQGHKRFDLRILMPPRAATPEALGELPVRASGGALMPLSQVADVIESDGPTQVRREGLTRTVRVEINLRGRDLVSFVNEAREKVAREVKLPTGYTVTWGGQFENFERAQARLAIVVPLALAIILGMLLWMFGNLRYAGAVFVTVPFALTGGILGLFGRGLSFSIPAAVGFIALAGVSVLNGVVIATAVRRHLEEGASRDVAVVDGATDSVRAVLTTAMVAALGFLPMAISTGAGSEVQRPLATVVIAGIFLSTVMTLYIFPGVLRLMLPSASPVRDPAPTGAEAEAA
ncbi:MAG: efflux RND transporter permease subunit [Myxococcaceae bacterium]|nr:efflux RND transporter permease subunit [Myxococcaceae bacterium]